MATATLEVNAEVRIAAGSQVKVNPAPSQITGIVQVYDRVFEIDATDGTQNLWTAAADSPSPDHFDFGIITVLTAGETIEVALTFDGGSSGNAGFFATKVRDVVPFVIPSDDGEATWTGAGDVLGLITKIEADTASSTVVQLRLTLFATTKTL